MADSGRLATWRQMAPPIPSLTPVTRTRMSQFLVEGCRLEQILVAILALLQAPLFQCHELIKRFLTSPSIYRKSATRPSAHPCSRAVPEAAQSRATRHQTR